MNGVSSEQKPAPAVTGEQKVSPGMEMRNRIRLLLAYLSQNLSGKEEALSLSLLSAVANEGVLFLGLPGKDKAMICRSVASAFSDFYENGRFNIGNGSYFEYFMTGSSGLEDICGPFDQTKKEYSGKGCLPTAKIAFLDDIWLSNPAVFNTLISIANEKKYRNGERFDNVPLIFLAAGSRGDDPYVAAERKQFEALRESFALHIPVNPIAGDDDFFKFVNSPNTFPPLVEEVKAALLSVEEVRRWQAKINNVVLSEEAKKVISTIRRKCYDYYISDNRWKKIIHVVKTCAFLNGRGQADLVDCSLIDYTIPNHSVEEILKQYAVDNKFDPQQHAQYKANIFARLKYYKILRASIEETKMKMEQKRELGGGEPLY